MCLSFDFFPCVCLCLGSLRSRAREQAAVDVALAAQNERTKRYERRRRCIKSDISIIIMLLRPIYFIRHEQKPGSSWRSIRRMLGKSLAFCVGFWCDSASFFWWWFNVLFQRPIKGELMKQNLLFKHVRSFDCWKQIYCFEDIFRYSFCL